MAQTRNGGAKGKLKIPVQVKKVAKEAKEPRAPPKTRQLQAKQAEDALRRSRTEALIRECQSGDVLKVTLQRFNIASMGVKISAPSLDILKSAGSQACFAIARKALYPQSKGDAFKKREPEVIFSPAIPTGREVRLLTAMTFKFPSAEVIQRLYNHYFHLYYNKFESDPVAPTKKSSIARAFKIFPPLPVDEDSKEAIMRALYDFGRIHKDPKWLYTRYLFFYGDREDLPVEERKRPIEEELDQMIQYYEERAEERELELRAFKSNYAKFLRDRALAREELIKKWNRLQKRALKLLSRVLDGQIRQGDISEETKEDVIRTVQHGEIVDTDDLDGMSTETISFMFKTKMLKLVPSKRGGFLIPRFNNST